MEPSDQPSANQSHSDLRSFLRSVSKAASLIVILIGCMVILGWIFNIPILKSVVPGLVTMKANTAISFILAGLSLRLWHFQQSHPHKPSFTTGFYILPCLVLLIGLITLAQYSFNINLGIDQLFFKESVNAVATGSPGRMAPNTALNFLILGAALLLFYLPRPPYAIAQFLTLGAFLIALLGFLGYIYGNAYFYKLDRSATAMALHTAIAFILLCFSILFARCDTGVMAAITGVNAGGVMAQRLYPAAILIPPFICWLILIGYRSRVYTPEMGISLLGILNVIIFSILIWWNARSLGIIDSQRLQAKQALENAFSELEIKAKQQEQLAMDLATAVREVTATMTQLGASADATAEQAAAADAETRQIILLSQQGSHAVQQTHLGMTTLQNKVQAISTETLRCQQLIREIANISDMVSDLASQTNMLALNASLEAVRAGDLGKGFGVVASEIRQLADQSRDSANTISRLVTDVQKAIHSTVNATDEGITTVDSGVEIAQETAEAFQGVAQAIHQIASFNQQIALNAHEQAVAIQQVVNMMNAINQRASG